VADTEDDATIGDALRGGDESDFARLVERHRAELRMHCYRMLAVGANRQPALATYVRVGEAGDWKAFAIGVLTVHGGRIVAIDAFHDMDLFRRFGLVEKLPADR
jgi:hypothetical protein